jgi:hypothetical protein
MSDQAEDKSIFDALDFQRPPHPYPGLRPFEKDEWLIFFGREESIDNVVGRLIADQFVTVHGDSGCGKSSLVRAGVLPRLEHECVRGGARWQTASMLPRSAPLGNLARALAELVVANDGTASEHEIRRILNLGESAAKPLSKFLNLDANNQLCVLVDQFEELFQYAASGNWDLAKHFVDVLRSLKAYRPSSIHVILTMRSEFLGSCTRFDGLAELINSTQYLLPGMRDADLVRSIIEPARMYGGRVSEEFAEALVRDTRQSQDQLPLMQHAVMLLYRNASTRVADTERWKITSDDYVVSGGAARLMSAHADAVYEALTRSDDEGVQQRTQVVVKRLFQSIIEITKEGHPVRRPQMLSTLADLTGASLPELTNIIHPMCADGVSFLKVYGRLPYEGDELIDITHEALIRNWTQIGPWLHEEAINGSTYERLLDLTAEHDADPRIVLGEAEAQSRSAWWSDRQPSEAWAARYSHKHPNIRPERVKAFLDLNLDPRERDFRIWHRVTLKEAEQFAQGRRGPLVSAIELETARNYLSTRRGEIAASAVEFITQSVELSRNPADDRADRRKPGQTPSPGAAFGTIFISHSSRDNAIALAFRDWLASEGITDAFLDIGDIGGGERWREAIRTAAERCEAVILLASPDSLASIECRSQVRLAEDMGKALLVLLVRDMDAGDPSLAGFHDRHIIDLSTHPHDASFMIDYQGRQETVRFNASGLQKALARLRQLGIGANSFVWRPRDLETASPYPGLRAFQEEDAAIFFGRDKDISVALDEIRRLRARQNTSLLVIQAPSGTGKSSFLRAGIWPRLRRDPEFLPLAIVRPTHGILTGDYGIIRQTEEALRNEGTLLTRGQLHDILSNGPTGLSDLIAAASSRLKRSRLDFGTEAKPPLLVLAIDQSEELFGQIDTHENIEFLAQLAKLLAGNASLRGPQILFVATMRADATEALVHWTQKCALDTPRIFALPPISPAHYADIIRRPLEVARQHGLNFVIEEAVVLQIIEDSEGSNALSLIQFVLNQLFDESRIGTSATLSLDQYRRIGGVKSLLQHRLASVKGVVDDNDFFRSLRLLLLPRLATWGSSGNEPFPLRLSAQESVLFVGARAHLRPLADALVEARLLMRNENVLEIANDVLLHQPPIIDWLQDEREFLGWLTRIASERQVFSADRRGPLDSREIQIAEKWASSRTEDVPPEDLNFVRLSKEVTQAQARMRRRRMALGLFVFAATAFLFGVAAGVIWLGGVNVF